MTDQVLLADIGGTNARFALLNHGRIGTVEHVKVADYATAYEAIEVFLARQVGRHVRAGMLGIAGPLENNRGILTNGRWIIDAGELQKTFALDTVHLLNDFETLAWSLPALGSSDLFSLGGQRPALGAPMVVVGKDRLTEMAPSESVEQRVSLQVLKT